MTDVLNSVKNLKVSGDLMDLALAGVFKYFEERALSGIIGNGTLLSGISKLGLGVGLDMFGKNNKIAKIGKMAFVMDGVEDITQYLIKMVTGNFNLPSFLGGSSNQIQTI